MTNIIHETFKHGANFKIGNFCIIKEGCEVGDDVTIKDYVRLAKGTKVGNNVYLDSGVKSSGLNRIGNNVVLRYDSIIARGVVIHDDVFISPQLMTENVNHKGKQIGGAEIGIGEWDSEKARYRVFIGTNVTLASGIEIASNVIIGSKANVRKSLLEPGVYVGNPAKIK